MIPRTGPDSGPADPALLVGFVATLALFGYVIWRLIQWMVKAPERPEPWSDDVASIIANDETQPLCHRCLIPHNPLADFCPECGAPVGTYTNWLPYPYLFSIGHALRAGTSGEFKRTPLTVFGFFLFGLAEYAIFAPIYWFMFLKSLRRREPPKPTSETQLPPSNLGD